MSVKAVVNGHPVPVVSRFSNVVFHRPREVYYIGGSDVLPAPLEPEREAAFISELGTVLS